MSINGLSGYSPQQMMSNVLTGAVTSGVKGSLNQQELQGQAALKLMEAAAVPIDPNRGQNIDIYA